MKRHIKIPVGDLRKTFQLETWSMTQETLIREARIEAKHYFENYYDGKKKPWFKILNEER